MGFQIQPAAYTDLDTLADVLVNAHVIDRFFEQLMPKVSHESRVKWYADSFRRTWELKWMKYYKVVELETKYVSFVRSCISPNRTKAFILYYADLLGSIHSLCGLQEMIQVDSNLEEHS